MKSPITHTHNHLRFAECNRDTSCGQFNSKATKNWLPLFGSRIGVRGFCRSGAAAEGDKAWTMITASSRASRLVEGRNTWGIEVFSSGKWLSLQHVRPPLLLDSETRSACAARLFWFSLPLLNALIMSIYISMAGGHLSGGKRWGFSSPITPSHVTWLFGSNALKFAISTWKWVNFTHSVLGESK